MNEAIENVFVSEDGTLRGRCAPAHLPCHDSGVDDVTPVPTLVPGDFTVRLGDVMPGWVMEGLEAEFGKYGGVASLSGRVARPVPLRPTTPPPPTSQRPSACAAVADGCVGVDVC